MKKKQQTKEEVAVITANLKLQSAKIQVANVLANLRQAEQVQASTQNELVEAVKGLAMSKGIDIDGPERWNFDVDTMTFNRV